MVANFFIHIALIVSPDGNVKDVFAAGTALLMEAQIIELEE